VFSTMDSVRKLAVDRDHNEIRIALKVRTPAEGGESPPAL